MNAPVSVTCSTASVEPGSDVAESEITPGRGL